MSDHYKYFCMNCRRTVCYSELNSCDNCLEQNAEKGIVVYRHQCESGWLGPEDSVGCMRLAVCYRDGHDVVREIH